MNLRALHGIAATAGGRVIDVAATYGFYALAARATSRDEFGELALGIAALQIAAVIARRGLDQSVLGSAPDGSRNRFAMMRVSLHAVALATLGWIAILLYSQHVPNATQLAILLGLPGMACSQLLIEMLRARDALVRAAFCESILQPVGAALAAGAAALLGGRIEYFAAALSISWLLPLFMIKAVAWSTNEPPDEERRRMWRTGNSMLGVVLLQQTTGSVDLFLLAAMAGSAEVATFAVAQKIASTFLLLHGAISSVATPQVREVIADPPRLARVYATITRWGAAASLPLIVLTVGTPTLFLRLFGASYVVASVLPLTILAVAYAGNSVSGPAGSLLLCSGNAKRLLRVSTINTVTMILAIAALAPRGASGAASGILIGQVFSRVAMIVAARRSTGVVTRPATVALIAFTVILAVALRPLGAASPAWDLARAALGCSIAFLAAMFLLHRTGELARLRQTFTSSNRDSLPAQ